MKRSERRKLNSASDHVQELAQRVEFYGEVEPEVVDEAVAAAAILAVNLSDLLIALRTAAEDRARAAQRRPRQWLDGH